MYASLSHATGVNQPLRFFKRFLAVEAIELDRNHIKRLVLARGFDLTAIGFGNYRSPQSIGSLEGADGEPFVVPSAVSMMARHQLAIQPYMVFGPDEVEARQKLLFDIASIIWRRNTHVSQADRDIAA